MPRLRFRKQERVKIIGGNAPFLGRRGTFLRYEKDELEERTVIVELDCSGSVHWFFRDEVSSVRAG